MSRDRLMRAALLLAERGMAIFPLHPGTKRPAVRRDWEGCATTSIEQIERWWHRAPYNIGVATGPSKLVVVDLDAPHRSTQGARHGRQVLSDLAVEAGVRLPERDVHSCDSRWRPAPLLPGTRGSDPHQHSGAPRAAHRHESSRRIRRRSRARINGRIYRITSATEPTPLPSWIEDRLRPRPSALTVPDVRHTAYVEAAVRNEAARVIDAVPGTRNSVLFQAAAKLGRFVPGGQLTDDDIRSTLVDASARHVGIEGFTVREAARTIDSGLRRSHAGSVGERPQRTAAHCQSQH